MLKRTFFKDEKRRRSFFLSFLGLSLVGLLFSYRLLEVPTGLTVDEGFLGYNAILLGRTGHDQNNRLLPVFTLARDGRDWHQPVTQYYLVLFFKIFGPSVFSLRFSSVLVALFSLTCLFFLGRKLLGPRGALGAGLIFILTPAVIMHAHLGTENIMPVPLAILWLLGLLLFEESGKKKDLVLAAVALGIGFYSYKGMRAIVPVWAVLTVIWLLASPGENWRNSFKKAWPGIKTFCLAIFPFFALIPVFETLYHGSIFDYKSPTIGSFYDFFYPWLSSFDLGFLFIKGDLMIHHSTQRHGMLLLATLPLFFLGIGEAVKRKKFWLLILAAFFTTPLLYGLVDSVHRASRLLVMAPLYALLAALGMEFLWEKRKGFLLLLVIALMFLNYLDFVNYYWFDYAKFSENVFGRLDRFYSYQALAQEAKARGLIPYIADNVDRDESAQFFEAIYFSVPAKRISRDLASPPGSILLTGREEVPGMERLGISLEHYHLQINPEITEK